MKQRQNNGYRTKGNNSQLEQRIRKVGKSHRRTESAEPKEEVDDYEIIVETIPSQKSQKVVDLAEHRDEPDEEYEIAVEGLEADGTVLFLSSSFVPTSKIEKSKLHGYLSEEASRQWLSNNGYEVIETASGIRIKMERPGYLFNPEIGADAMLITTLAEGVKLAVVNGKIYVSEKK